MNPHLKSILDFIQQGESLTVEEKNVISKSLNEADKELEITAFKLDRTEKVKRTTAILLEETIEELEQKRKAVEAQNRELEIESSLERVRTVAMSMNKPGDMLLVCRVISDQLELLKVKDIRNVQTAIIYENKGTYFNYEYYRLHDKSFITEVDYKLHPAQSELVYQMKKGPEAFFTKSFSGEDLHKWLAYQKTTNQFVDSYLETATSINWYFYSMGEAALGVSTYAPLNEEHVLLFKRFRNVFEMAYRRFLDIEKAIAQAREAQIELALERVRARTMAMQKSEELSDTAYVLFQQFKDLGEKPHQITIGIIKETEGYVEFNITGADGSGSQINRLFKVDINEPALIQKLVKGWKENKKSSVIELAGKELTDWVSYRVEISGIIDNTDYSNARRFVAAGYFTKGLISISTINPIESETCILLERFAQVFDQTYTRFLDLQKAEEQAREATIQLALERVRARSLAMHHTSELQDIVKIVAGQLQQMGLNINGGVFITINEELEQDIQLWASLGAADYLQKVFVPFFDRPIFTQLRNAIKKGNNFFNETYSKEEKDEMFQHLFHYSPWNELSAERREELLSRDGGLTRTAAISKYTSIVITNHNGNKFSEQEIDILKRFGSVFEQSYTRFLDLQKAEAQAREAQIEAALERVRSRTMGMQKSEELKEVIQVVYEQFVHLNIKVEHAGFVMDYKERDDYDIWVADPLGVPSQLIIPYFDSVYYNRFNEAKEKGEDFFATNLDFEEKNRFYKKLFEYVPGLPEEAKEFYFSCPGLAASTVLLENVCLYIENFSGVPFTDDENATLMRFGKVFQQTYTRFLDLQKAEAQARESQIEAALERVRSKAMSMQKSEDLANAVAIVFEELDKLNLGLLRCGIGILNREKRCAQVWTTTISDNDSIVQVTGDESMDIHPLLKGAFDAWLKQEEHNYVLKGQDLHNYYQALVRENFHLPQSQSLVSGTDDVVQYYFNATFSAGGLFAFSDNPFHEEAKSVIRRFADVFNLTYTRFNDIKQAEKLAMQAQADLENLKIEKKRTEEALTELKAAQALLIQAEKMASLGELTAGIAHEIQNPLNFVNNFSEVSNELIDEMNAEIEKGDMDEARIIANDIKQNLEKIYHHGKRADAIVKGMLQHSRSSSATKEPTDINKLADEYLRLAYHGLRAKDKTFNATMKTDYDETIGNINIIPQDIGRVILNLITNAFYVVDEKKKSGIANYKPTVSVSTKKINGKIEIKVTDNGNGIPQKLLDKIFQPFFTTKPSGQGTGLGLSLSYDIVKAHAGELKVETKEGEGSTFNIQLPTS
jgi:signal transduction histidine kinase